LKIIQVQGEQSQGAGRETSQLPSGMRYSPQAGILVPLSVQGCMAGIDQLGTIQGFMYEIIQDSIKLMMQHSGLKLILNPSTEDWP
jgi:hypothetical protein